LMPSSSKKNVQQDPCSINSIKVNKYIQCCLRLPRDAICLPGSPLRLIIHTGGRTFNTFYISRKRIRWCIFHILIYRVNTCILNIIQATTLTKIHAYTSSKAISTATRAYVQTTWKRSDAIRKAIRLYERSSCNVYVKSGAGSWMMIHCLEQLKISFQ
jgi:hypothetical protein